MKIVRRDPTKGYLDTWLWIPKSMINVDATKSALSFMFSDSYSGEQRVLALYKEATHHLLVPRTFWEPGALPYEVIDCRPRHYQHVDFKSRIRLDHRPAEIEGQLVMMPTGDNVQRVSIQKMIDSMGGVLQLACGKGKGQPLSEDVMTPQGVRRIGDLKIGDHVLGADGYPTKVLGVFPQGLRPVFRVTFSDGTSTRCDDQHLWYVKYDRRKWCVVSTTEMKERGLRNKAGWKYAVPYCEPAQFESTELPLNPWLLGAWLGDGGFSPHLTFTNPETDVIDGFIESLPQGDTATMCRPKNRCQYLRVNKGKLSAQLAQHGLEGCRSWEKFIPGIYLTSCEEDRWELLRGLLDTDGSIANQNRTVEYCTTSPMLARGVEFLVRSLGGRISTIERQTTYRYKGFLRTGRLSFRQRITFPAGRACPVSSRKHAAKWDSSPGQRRFKYITGLELVGNLPTACIKVDAEDECYLTTDFTVTHNTVVALEKIARGQVPSLILLDNTNLLEQWKGDIEEFLEVPGGVGLMASGKNDWRKAVVLATYQTVASRADDMPEEVRRWFGQIFWDEGHHVSAPVFSKTVTVFYGNRYSLTATPERDDGWHIIADFHIGRVLHKDLVQTMTTNNYFYWTGLQLDLTQPAVARAVLDVNGEVHLSKVKSYFGQWRDRMWTVMNHVIDALAYDRKVLVLSDSVDEVINLMTMWTRGPTAFLYTDIPMPTPADVGETLLPTMLLSKDAKKLQKRIEKTWKLCGVGTHPDKINDDLQAWAHHLVGKKILAELKDRQRKFLKQLLSEQSGAGVMTFGVPPKIRQKFLDNKQVVFAITKYGKEGLDCPDLDTVIVSSLFSSKNGLQQLMGRPTRPKPGKKTPTIVLMVDDVGQCHGMAQKLQRHMRKWPIEEGGPFSFELINYPKMTCRISNLKQAFGL